MAATLVSKPSNYSLLITAMFNDQELATATAFVAVAPGGRQPYLVTNRHVVTGRDHYTCRPLSAKCGIPNKLRVAHNSSAGFGLVETTDMPLLAPNETPLWFEHTSRAGEVDVVALRLGEIPGVTLFPYQVVRNVEHLIEPGSIVRIVGFPFGKSTGKFAVWSTGFVASEPEINYENQPVYLVDCRSRTGQSGSPVIVYTGGHGDMLAKGQRQINVGDIHLLGVYSGRINNESDLGRVWKPYILADILLAADAG